MGVKYIVVDHGTKNKERHQCDKPNAYKRWRDNIYEDGIIQCQECKKYWKWVYIPYTSSNGGFFTWERYHRVPWE
jgi:hypothetical protein